MKNIIIVLFFALVLLAGCADVKDDITEPQDFSSIHPEGYGKYSSADFHGKTLKDINWDLDQCKTCHGGDYSGGTAGESCNDCHSGSSGPEGCRTCHGNDDHSYPPKDLDDNTSITVRGVGLHELHMESDIADVSCFTCHPRPDFSNRLSHFDDNKAEVVLTFETAYGLGDGAYNMADGTCSNVYCHGSFSFPKDSSSVQWIYQADAMTGIDTTISWTATVTGECATCHNNPPTGHFNFDISTCGNSGCHPAVVDNAGNIIDKTKHINGKINYNNDEY